MNYKAWAACMAAAAIFSVTTGVGAQAPYTDLRGMASRDAVDYLYDTHCLTFVQGEQFHPNQTLTRGELAQLVYAAAPTMTAAESTFSDVAGNRSAEAIAAVSAQGILSGYADGTFEPDKTVSREEFAGVVYRYLQYGRMAEADDLVEAYADEADVSEENKEAVAVLHSKHIMVAENNQFRPKDGVTRAEAVRVFYELMHSDADYVSHVQVQKEVMKALSAEYGSTSAFLQQGTMYWDKDTLVLGIKGNPGSFLKKRIHNEIERPDAVVFRQVSLSRLEYTQLMTRAVHSLVDSDGVQNYVGARPDYRNEQVVITVRKAASDEAMEELAKRVDMNHVRIETLQERNNDVLAQASQPKQDDKAGEKDKSSRGITKDGKVSYSPLIDQAASDTITLVQNNVIH